MNSTIIYYVPRNTIWAKNHYDTNCVYWINDNRIVFNMASAVFNNKYNRYPAGLDSSGNAYSMTLAMKHLRPLTDEELFALML